MAEEYYCAVVYRSTCTLLTDKEDNCITSVYNLVPRVSPPGRVWSRASVTIENAREGYSLNKEFVALSFVEFKARLIASRCDSAITLDDLQ